MVSLSSSREGVKKSMRSSTAASFSSGLLPLSWKAGPWKKNQRSAFRSRSSSNVSESRMCVRRGETSGLMPKAWLVWFPQFSASGPFRLSRYFRFLSCCARRASRRRSSITMSAIFARSLRFVTITACWAITSACCAPCCLFSSCARARAAAIFSGPLSRLSEAAFSGRPSPPPPLPLPGARRKGDEGADLAGSAGRPAVSRIAAVIE
mmetsp:Transcript_47450/g.140150  ORF Transcript_47450/g.140150 Transcript_47450/m.140150 type:complete len:208 (-) Transcript_47450:116-739(-)